MLSRVPDLVAIYARHGVALSLNKSGTASGVLIVTLIGVLPGVGPSPHHLLLPITFGLDPTGG